MDMAHVMRLAREYSLTVIEDNAENLGWEYQGKQAGRHGLDECLSVKGNRVIICFRGEMVLMDECKFSERAHYLTTQAKDNSVCGSAAGYVAAETLDFGKGHT